MARPSGTGSRADASSPSVSTKGFDPARIVRLSRADRYPEAVAVVLATGDARVARIHRDLRMGYNEAAACMERMEAGGIVSSPNLVGVRAVLMRPNDEMEMCDQCSGAGGDGRGEICGKCDGAGGYPASAIEARSDATGTGAAEGESAVPQADAPKMSQ